MKCSACYQPIDMETCEIVGAQEGHLMVNCPCTGTVVAQQRSALTPKFELLNGISHEIGNIEGPEEFSTIRMALTFIRDGLTDPFDIRFGRDLENRIDRKEKLMAEIAARKAA